MLDTMMLNAEKARVLGSLVEKALTTPQQYPLTFTSLVAACNQATNRDPVVEYDEATVMTALDELKAQHLVRFVLPPKGRTALRYRHVADETLALDRRQCALVAVLLLRGAQTVGELRLRTDRMTEFESLDQVQRELELLASLEDPLAERLGRRPGQKEERWSCPLAAAADAGGVAGRDDGSGGPLETPSRGDAPLQDGGAGAAPPPVDRVEALATELAALTSEVRALRDQLEDLRTSLGG